jgi:hypothetical protein
MNALKRFFGHLHTVTRHRHIVIKNCARAGILWQGIKHDLSKYSPTEFVPGVKYYTGDRSPNEGERRDIGYSKAWIHHKGRNKHHYEYWQDIDLENKSYKYYPMPYRYLAEMFCDRVAASKVYRGKDYKDNDPLVYFNGGHAKEMMAPETARDLEELLTMLAEKGEKETFKYLKTEIKRRKKNER